MCPNDIAGELTKSFTETSARLGIVVSTTDRRVLVNIEGDRAFIPASAMKLFTTARALAILGEDFRIATTLYVSASGELRLEGGGDPSFTSDRDLPKLVAQLKPGQIPIGVFQVKSEPWGNPYGMGWEWEDLQEAYAPPIGGVVIDQNILEWQITPQLARPVFRWNHPSKTIGWKVINLAHTVPSSNPDTFKIDQENKTLILKGNLPLNTPPIGGATPISDPNFQFEQLLKQQLKLQGITALQPSKAVVFSAPIRELIAVTNKESDNLYAEQLLRIIGRQNLGTAPDYEIAGKNQISQSITTPGFHIADGSGLSRHNQATPQQVVDLLITMQGVKPFRQSLSIGGKNGTLAKRLQGLNIEGKTGTLSGIHTLSGYLTPPKFPTLMFSIMINHSQQSASNLREITDRMVRTLDQLEPCGAKP